MDFVQRMKRAMQRGRSATLPPGELAAGRFAVLMILYVLYTYPTFESDADAREAAFVLLPYVMQNQGRWGQLGVALIVPKGVNFCYLVLGQSTNCSQTQTLMWTSSLAEQKGLWCTQQPSKWPDWCDRGFQVSCHKEGLNWCWVGVKMPLDQCMLKIDDRPALVSEHIHLL